MGRFPGTENDPIFAVAVALWAEKMSSKEKHKIKKKIKKTE